MRTESWSYDRRPAVTRAVYELPPPGQRRLYAPVFTLQLRTGFELRVYAQVVQ